MRQTSDPVLRSAVRQHLLEEIAGTSAPKKNWTGATDARRWVRLGAISLVIVAVVVGSIIVIKVGSDLPDRPTPAQHASPTQTPSVPASIFQGAAVTATGTLSGAASGVVHLTSSPETGFSVEIDVTHLDGLQGRQVELATSLQAVDCPLTNDTDRSRAIDFGIYNLSKPTTLQLPALGKDYGNFSADFSYMSVLALRPNGGNASSDDYCTPSKMGIVYLTWSRPAAYVSLRAVDHGEAPAARGEVHSRAGQPVSYDVAPDDQIASVAARFGLTAQEVLYLNPRRQMPTSTMLYVGETLNLDTSDR